MTISWIFLRRFIPILAIGLIFPFSLVFLFIDRPFIFFLSAVITIFLSVFFTWFLIKQNFKKFWPLIFIPLLLCLSAFLFFFFIQNQFFEYFFIPFFIFLIWFFLETIYRFFYQPRKYLAHSLENISFSLNLVSFFWLHSGLFALNIFLNFPFYYFLPLIFFFSFCFMALNFWLAKISLKENFLFIIIPTIFLLEISTALLFLPTNFYFNSFVLTVLFFFLNVLIKDQLFNVLDSRKIKKYLFGAGSLLILIFILTKWK